MERNKITIILGAALALAAFVLYFFLYSPMAKRISSAHRQYQQIAENITQARITIASLQEIQIGKRRPISEKNMKSVIDQIAAMAKQKGVVIISLVPSEIEPAEHGYKICPLEIEAECGYKAFGVFLGQLEKLDYAPIEVKSFSLSNSQNITSRLKLKLAINLYLAEN
ncbi:MAG: type II secretion system protein GspM [Candidatus Omnitrophota bacterium]